VRGILVFCLVKVLEMSRAIHLTKIDSRPSPVTLRGLPPFAKYAKDGAPGRVFVPGTPIAYVEFPSQRTSAGESHEFAQGALRMPQKSWLAPYIFSSADVYGGCP
jgi:hypothetical protein